MRRLLRGVLAASMVAPLAHYACASSSGPAATMGEDAAAPSTDAALMEAAAEAAPAFTWCEAGAPVLVEDAGIVTPPGCDYVEYSPCGLPDGWRLATSGELDAVTCLKVCPLQTNAIQSCAIFYGQDTIPDSSAAPADADFDAYAFDGGATRIECSICTVGGRRPAGLRRAYAVNARSEVGAYFARQAHLEAASVPAFRRLRDELRAHGAPRDLVRGAERALRDEVRHARVTARLARAYGAEAPPVAVDACDERSLEAMALENAVEGCVREMFGALVAQWQAENADDPVVAAAMRTIARDETRHAALAWAVAHWVEPRLGARARARIEQARRAAMVALRDEVAATSPSGSLRNAAGVPIAATARRLAEAIAAVT